MLAFTKNQEQNMHFVNLYSGFPAFRSNVFKTVKTYTTQIIGLMTYHIVLRLLVVLFLCGRVMLLMNCHLSPLQWIQHHFVTISAVTFVVVDIRVMLQICAVGHGPHKIVLRAACLRPLLYIMNSLFYPFYSRWWWQSQWWWSGRIMGTKSSSISC